MYFFEASIETCVRLDFGQVVIDLAYHASKIVKITFLAFCISVVGICAHNTARRVVFGCSCNESLGRPSNREWPALQTQTFVLLPDSGEFESDEHFWSELNSRSTIAENRSTKRLVHDTVPMVVLHNPDSYSTQGAPIRAHIIACIHFVYSCRALCTNSPFGPVKPALHIQSTFMSLASGEFEFSSHKTHASVIEPTAVKHLPAKQDAYA